MQGIIPQTGTDAKPKNTRHYTSPAQNCGKNLQQETPYLQDEAKRACAAGGQHWVKDDAPRAPALGDCGLASFPGEQRGNHTGLLGRMAWGSIDG